MYELIIKHFSLSKRNSRKLKKVKNHDKKRENETAHAKTKSTKKVLSHG